MGHSTGCSSGTRDHLHVCALKGATAADAGWPVVVLCSPRARPACVLGHPDDAYRHVLVVQHMVRRQQTGRVEVGPTIHWSIQDAPGATEVVHLLTRGTYCGKWLAVCSEAGPFQGLAGGCCSSVLQQPALKEHF